MIFKISHTIYGLQITIKLFGYELWIRGHKDYMTAKTLGIKGRTLDGKSVPFFDFDNHLLEHLIPELQYLQTRHKLSSLYLFQSSQKPHSYHVIGLDKLDYEEWINILNETTCDKFYREMPITNDYKEWCIRITPKLGSIAPRLIKILPSPYNERPKSRPHWLFLKYHHNIKSREPSNLDNYTKLYTTTYTTLNYLTKKLEIKKYKKPRR
jgi:hypothetical protein